MSCAPQIYSNVHHSDFQGVRHDVDHIITDPPYDTDWTFLPLLRAQCKGNIIAFASSGNLPPLVNEVDEVLFWIKPRSTKNWTKRCGRFVEMILVWRGYEAAFNVLHWSQMTGVFMDSLVAPSRHPYQKPLTLMERLVRLYTNPNDLVFDPFMGSGTTGVAARRLGRRFVGTELDAQYVAVAQSRLDELCQ